MGLVDGDITCYEPWLSNHKYGRIWSYSSTGELKCGSTTLSSTGHEFNKGDTIRVTVDMDWLPPAAPTRTANAANNTTTTTTGR